MENLRSYQRNRDNSCSSGRQVFTFLPSLSLNGEIVSSINKIDVYLLLKILCLQNSSLEFPITIDWKVYAFSFSVCVRACVRVWLTLSIIIYKIEITFWWAINVLCCWEFPWTYLKIENFNYFLNLDLILATWLKHLQMSYIRKKFNDSFLDIENEQKDPNEVRKRVKSDSKILY